MKNAYNTIIMCRKQLPTIEERLERVIGDIGPHETIQERADGESFDSFFCK